MELQSYFENTRGTGVLATADSEGNVDCAIYARPHVMEDGSLAFIMRDRLSHKNLQSNSRAAYMFIEEGAGYKGKRLFLRKTGEEENSE
ncbi:MAG TPA: pyridoxamine 5'-phosphate oxidase family protein, partial [Desulfosalsimonadaceae bacterium]|nr:pyridoxamine 5'-phosphate oxidase family protein [Desulfosalsimonadaceae bacterium]